MKIAVLAEEGAATAEALAELVRRRAGDIVLVVAVPAAGPRLADLRRGIGYAGYRLGRARTRRRYLGMHVLRPPAVDHPRVLAELERARPDHLVTIGLAAVPDPALLAVARHSCVNLHPALLPAGQGGEPVLRAALTRAGHGATVHLVRPGAGPGGPILAQRASAPPLGRSVLHTEAWVYRTAVDLLDAVLDDLDEYALRAVPQLGGRPAPGLPTRAELRAARACDVRLCTLRDLRAVHRGVRTASPRRAPLPKRARVADPFRDAA